MPRTRRDATPSTPAAVLAALAFGLGVAGAAGAQARKDPAFDMGPATSPELARAVASAGPAIAPGPFEPTWDSVRENYRVPAWFSEGKFGVFLHWGVYAVPAYHNEWYAKHMYATYADWHAEHFGPQDRFGYKDFIPRFACEKFDPDAWAALFRKAGARYVIPTAEHHDGFSLWDSDLNRWNAARMGPRRDLIGELAAAARREGLKFGVSNHSIEHYDFIQPRTGLRTDLDDPATADFYWTRHDEPRLREFLGLWVAKNFELIDRYRPDMLWFDNGVNHRAFDPLKLKVAAHYYNRARGWGREVSISTKKSAYLAGSILDFEKVQRVPKGVLPGAWQVDDPIGSTWGYTEGMRVAGPSTVVGKLVDVVSKNGNLLLNLSPMADGTIPEAQRSTLLAVGDWLAVNGEAIYGTHAWSTSGEGEGRGGYRFTVKGDALYAIALAWPGDRATIASLALGRHPGPGPRSVTLLGHDGELPFARDAEGLRVTMPARRPCDHAFALKIAGLELAPPPPPGPAIAPP